MLRSRIIDDDDGDDDGGGDDDDEGGDDDEGDGNVKHAYKKTDYTRGSLSAMKKASSKIDKRQSAAPPLTTTTTTPMETETMPAMNLTEEEIIANILNSRSKEMPEAAALTLVYCLLLVAGANSLLLYSNHF